MAEDGAEFIDLTLGIQADIFSELAADFARINPFAAAETIRTIEKKIVRDLTECAIDLRARRLSAKGIAQVAGYLADTIEEARQKMAEGENNLRSANGEILAHILKSFVEMKERVAKLLMFALAFGMGFAVRSYTNYRRWRWQTENGLVPPLKLPHHDG